MNLPWPRCGNEKPHPAHPALTFGPPDCDGWTADQQLVRHLITSVNEYVREHYMPGEPPPDGLRLEMHPAIRRCIMMDRDLCAGPWTGGELPDWFPVPVKVTTDLAKNQWRLVIVTEEVLLEGKAADDPR